MKKLKNRLEKLNACSEARDWVGNKSLKKAWKKCKRGDWMFWYYFKEVGFTKDLVKAKADCASLVKHLMKDQRSLNALQVCYDYVDGKISKKELRRVANAAFTAAYSAADAAAASAYAAANSAAVSANAASANAATDAYDAAYSAADAAADAAYSAVWNDSACVNAADAARKETLKKCADICREVLTESLFKKI